MCQQVRSQILFLILVLCAPLAVCAQSLEPHERFSVEPSEPGIFYGVGFVNTEFIFTADVTGAVRYELDIGDGVIHQLTPGSDGKAVYTHSYDDTRNYEAVLKAWRDGTIDPIVLPLQVLVKPPPAVPQPTPTHTRFSVAPSDPDFHDDIEVPWADFTFTADVSGAESYELDFGELAIERDIRPGPDGKAILRHIYQEPGSYRAAMKAWRNTGELIENELFVSVQAPPPPPSSAHFSVAPSDPITHDDIKFPWADFTFTADVTEAVHYELNFGDENFESYTPPGSDRKAAFRHVYKEPRSFKAKMKVLRSTGELVEKEFLVLVQAPAEPVKSDTLLWLLLLALIAIILLAVKGLAVLMKGTNPVTFEPKMDTGRVSVTGSTTADDAVSMRVQRDAGQTVISMDSGAQQ